MKNPLAKLIPLLARGIAPTAAVASGLMSPIALGASGDLDPSFADVGRLGPLLDLDGAAWSLQVPTDDDGIVFAGGNFDEGCAGWYCYYTYDFDASGFLGRLSDTGSIDRTSEGLEETEVLDVGLQPDGKAVAVGRTELEEDRTALTVFRMQADGSLDTTFGDSGFVRLPTTMGGRQHASSVALDPDGRIVVAGSRNGVLVVLRLLQDGTLDAAFGDAGIFVGPPDEVPGARARVVRTTNGGYRVAANLRDFRRGSDSNSPCLLVGLTASGALDSAFGTNGTVRLNAAAGATAACSSMVAQSDGNLLLAGRNNSQGFAARLLDSGARDSTFDASTIASAMEDATALAVGADGSIIVAGRGPEGVSAALVMRLQADGELDASFGNAGSTWIDLPSDYGSRPFVHDMKELPEGQVLLAGGDLMWRTARPFLVRLVGDSGEGPGVLGVTRPQLAVKEQEQQAVLTVRRTGGAAGSVSVQYQTMPQGSASAGQDYTAVSGRLEWNDGDAADRQIVIPIASNVGVVEGHESFVVSLSGAQGDAGLGTRNAIVEIAPDGEPGGQLFILAPPSVGELGGSVQLTVYRQFYFGGAVSVTVTPTAGTARAGDDFTATPVTVSWGDGDSSSRTISLDIRDDTIDEELFETFTVALSNPTGGAILGPDSIASIRIVDNEGSASGPRGGGWFGYLSVLFLGVVGFLRSASRRRQAGG